MRSQRLVTVDSSAKMGALSISPSTEQGHSSRVCRGWQPAPARSSAPRAHREEELLCACPGWAVHAELVPTPFPHAVTPSHCWEVGRSRAQRESCASLPAVFPLAGTSPSSCSYTRNAAASQRLGAHIRGEPQALSSSNPALTASVCGCEHLTDHGFYS